MSFYRILPVLSCLLATSALCFAVFTPANTQLDVPWLFLNARIGLDATGKTFLLFSSILWACGAVYSLGYLKGDPRRKFFDIFFVAAMIANFGLIISLDAITFYVCFALMSFASYGLVVHNRDVAARRAGRIYIILVVLGEVALFAALVGLYGGNTSGAALLFETKSAATPLVMLLLIIGFGIKAGVVGLHVWLPLAHPAAPVPASAVLSGAMIKAGLLGWIRFLPLGESGFENWGFSLMIAGLVAIFFGVLVGLVQTSPKTILAYSSISQMGFMTIGVGAGLIAPEYWPGLLLAISAYALHHGLAKGALFLSVGMGPALSRWGWVGVGLPALALAGAPFTSGAISKIALKSKLSGLPEPWPECLALALPIAAVGTGLLMIRFVLVLRNSRASTHGHEDHRFMLVSWLALVACSTVVLWFWEPQLAQGSLKPAKLLTVLWPVALAGLSGWIVSRLGARVFSRIIGVVPPGDLVVIFEKVISSASGFLKRLRNPQTRPPVQLSFDRLTRCLMSWETNVNRWIVATFLFFTLILIFYALSSG